MTSPILVTGGTGTLGRQVVPRLRNTGRGVRVLSRHGRTDEEGIRYLTGDLATGEGVSSRCTASRPSSTAPVLPRATT